MSNINEDKIFKEDKKSILHYIKVMKDIKQEEDRKKEIENKAKKEERKKQKAIEKPYIILNKYNNLSNEDKKGLYENWLKYFPLEPDQYKEYLTPINMIEMNNYLHSRIDTEFFELFNVFGNPYQFNKIFHDDPTSKKLISYPYTRQYFLTTKELKKLTIKKIFHMYLDRCIDNYKLEKSKETDKYIINKINDEKRRIIEYYNRNSKTYKRDFIF